MMSWLVSTSLSLRVLVVALGGLLIILGVNMAGDTALDVFPEFAPPLIEIQTEAPGLSTEEVESLVTVPIENALQGAPWVMYGRRPQCKRNLTLSETFGCSHVFGL